MAMAASLTSSLSSTFSSLSLRRFSLLPSNSKPSCLSLSTPKSLSFKPIKCQSPDSDTVYFLDEDPVELIKYDPPEVPEDTEEFAEPSIDDELEETPEQIAEAYEKLYAEDIFSEEEEQNPFDLGITPRQKFDDEFEEQLVQVRRVTKVVKGGRQLHFRALVVVGDRQGKVGVGVAQATEVDDAVEKSAIDARRHLVKVPMTKYLTFPHRANGKYGAATVMLRPAAPGSGVNAGGAVRVVLEMAGIQNALGKQLRSKNPMNNARATIDAILRMRTHKEVAAERGIPMEELWK